MGANGTLNFSSFFTPEAILCQLEVAAPEEAWRQLLERLALQRGIGNVDTAYEAVRSREETASTVVAPGLAVPHARLEGVHELVVGIATHRDGIPYGPAGERVHLMILLLAPKDAPGLYLQALSSLTAICEDPATPQTVAALATPEEVYRFFERGGMVLPDYVCAGDVMAKQPSVLKENDTLETAIDTFVQKGTTELPVIDTDGDLVGVVAALELLRVCLPDYILWMEDLSPILNFEPFAEILRNESNTWLAEIMRFDYASVTAEAPAVQVAKEITKRGADRAYVVEGKRLVGVITLEDFLLKVLRE